MYQNILVAIDLSEVSEKTIKKALEIAKLGKANVHICYVINVNDMMTQTAYSYAINTNFQEQMVKPLQREFEKFCEKHQIKSEHIHFIEGSPQEEILKCAQGTSSDLIVLGKHSHSRVGMLGSVASLVANKAPCDVLIVSRPFA